MEILILTVAVLVLAFSFSLVRKAIISQGVSFNRHTGLEDEQMTLSLNFTIFDTEKSKRAKLARLLALADERRAYRWEQYQATVDEAQKAKLKAAK